MPRSVRLQPGWNEPAPPSVAQPSVASVQSTFDSPENLMEPPYHSATAAGGPDLSHHPADVQAMLQRAVTGPVAFGKTVTEENMQAALAEVRRLRLPAYMGTHFEDDQLQLKIPQSMYPGHLYFHKGLSDDLGAICRNCSCMATKFDGQSGKWIVVKGPKKSLSWVH